MKAMTAADEMSVFKMDKDLMKVTNTMMEGWSQVNNQLVAFAQTQLRQNMAAAEQLRNCQSPKEIYDVQLKLAREAYDDYMEEARKLGQVIAKVSTDTLGCLTMQAK